MSIMRVICEKISTLCPRAFIFTSSLCSSTILPHEVYRWSPIGSCVRSSTPGKRYGWLQHFLNCITIFRMAVREPLELVEEAELMVSMSLSSTWRYRFFCTEDIPVNKMVSDLGGRDFSTSALSLRSMKGLSSLCSWPIMRCLASWSSTSRLNQSSNWSEEANTSGSRKFSRAHSSCRLFCRGVPVSSSLCLVFSCRTVVENCEASFFRRWASSMMR
mmetsp:Transcript_8051/g.17597  ORF Transcript_8051/g.17597 Transcript_8051/m.17597 type:complete len:217 (+) Transcript_8051:2062-2712(+)